LALAHDIACVASTCRGFRDAARLALAARSWSGEVVTLDATCLLTVAAIRDGRILTGSKIGNEVKVWRGDELMRQTVTGSRHLPAVTFFTPAHFTMHCAPGGGRAGREPRCRV